MIRSWCWIKYWKKVLNMCQNNNSKKDKHLEYCEKAVSIVIEKYDKKELVNKLWLCYNLVNKIV